MHRILQPKPRSILVLKRAALYFLALDFLAFFYYLVGNGQGFLAETQLLLLAAVSRLSAAAFLSALAGLSAAAFYWARKTLPFSWQALAGWIAGLTLSGALAFLSSAVRAFAAGA